MLLNDSQVTLDGIPLMSPNCWQFIQAAVEEHPQCRYLEWGSGNSTLALLHAALDDPRMHGLEILSVEGDRQFAQPMFDQIVDTFRRASVNAEIRVRSPYGPRPHFPETLRYAKEARDLEADFLKVLWKTRNDRFWIGSVEADASHRGVFNAWRRTVSSVQCSAAFHQRGLSRLFESVSSRRPDPGPIGRGTVESPPAVAFDVPVCISFETGPVRIDYVVAPPLRNRLWHHGPILDGLYREFADYVSVPVDGRFDVILVDGRARISCLKRVRSDDLLAPGGVLFLHDAWRPSHYEALSLFPKWSFVRGVENPTDTPWPIGSDRQDVPYPLVSSGSSIEDFRVTRDRELYFYRAPG